MRVSLDIRSVAHCTLDMEREPDLIDRPSTSADLHQHHVAELVGGANSHSQFKLGAANDHSYFKPSISLY